MFGLWSAGCCHFSNSDRLWKVNFEDERSQPRSNGQVNRDNNNCNIKDVNKSKNNTNKEEFGGKDPEDEEEKSEEL